MRVRWALGEVGQPYRVRLVSFRAMKEPAHLAVHPFGQIPTYEEGDLALFESGPIVFHVAEHHAGLLPEDTNARSRTIAWMFAALNTMEPPIVDFGMATLLESDKPWYAARLPMLEERVRNRLSELSTRLGNSDWLDGEFSAGDLLMVTVLRRLNASGIVEEIRTCPRMWPARKRDPPTSAPSKINWRSSPATRGTADRLAVRHSTCSPQACFRPSGSRNWPSELREAGRRTCAMRSYTESR